jgi:hypothetical protein
MPQLVGHQFGVIVDFVHERRMGAPHDVKIHPSESRRLQLRANAPALKIVGRKRGLAGFRGKHPGIVVCVARNLLPFADVGQNAFGKCRLA